MASFSSARSARSKAVLYDYPWQALHHWKYLMYVACAAWAAYQTLAAGIAWCENVVLHVLVVTAMRYLLFQIWGSVCRLPCISRRHQIIEKGISFEQIDHEANWENILLVVIVFAAAIPQGFLYRGTSANFKLWDATGIALAFLLHAGPVEWIYYWAHRALHHHSLYTAYHSHHHLSFVTQPSTSSNHPMVEGVFYNLLFAIPIILPVALGHGSIASMYIYILFIDFMNGWGHSNFEFIPSAVFDMLPPLKYLVYSPTFHSLHHSKVHTNFSLFMPIYDYIYGTVDPTSDELYRRVRQGNPDRVDCVYLSHPTSLLSVFHLPFGVQTFANQPFAERWYMWAMAPLALPVVLMLWLFASPFAAATHLVGRNFELQTWMIPRFRFQYKLELEKPKIEQWIEDCILEAQEIGVKVVALGLWNKDRIRPGFLKNAAVSVAVVNGETLASVITCKKVLAREAAVLSSGVFVAEAESRVGQAVVMYLCEHGVRVMACCQSVESFERVSASISSSSRSNLTFAGGSARGNNCKVWIVGQDADARQQRWAPAGTCFYTCGVFPLSFRRDDCTYECIPSLQLSDQAKTIHACEDILPRYVVRACYAAAMIHSIENWKHNDVDEAISTCDMDKSWEAAMRHKFSL